MNKELQEALTICMENEAKRYEIYDAMYKFWQKNIEPCLKQGIRYKDLFIDIDETQEKVCIPSVFLYYGSGRSEIMKNWPMIVNKDIYASPELILKAMIIWLEKTSCEINKDRSKLSQVHQALRKHIVEE